MFFFIIGLFLGSFLNNLALRLEKEEDFIFSRSKCYHCNKPLNWYELIPILSFLIQKGKCLHCQKPIPWRYPLTEIITGFWVFLLAFTLKTNFHLISMVEFIFYLIFLSILFSLALYDLKTYLVDDKLIIIGIISGIIFNFIKSYFKMNSRDFSYLINYLFNFGYLDYLISSLFISSILGLIFLITKGKGLGFGDIKVAFLIGMFLKIGDALFSIIIASLLGSVYGLYLAFKTKNLKQPVPFVPFMFIGVLGTMIFGFPISKFYFQSFIN